MPDRLHALFDDDGAVLRYTIVDRPGIPMAGNARVADGRTASSVARTVVRELPGWLVQTDDLGLAAALVKAGGRPVRQASIMQCDLRDLRDHSTLGPAPIGLSILPVEECANRASWLAAVPSWRAAYPPDHPDHFLGDDLEAATALHRVASGEECGPLHRSSGLVQDRDGAVCAGIIVTLMPAQPPWGGPWVADIWRDPVLRGRDVGRWLLMRAQHHLARDGHIRLGLTVSAGNPARRSYDRAGFRAVAQSASVQLPPSH